MTLREIISEKLICEEQDQEYNKEIAEISKLNSEEQIIEYFNNKIANTTNKNTKKRIENLLKLFNLLQNLRDKVEEWESKGYLEKFKKTKNEVKLTNISHGGTGQGIEMRPTKKLRKGKGPVYSIAVYMNGYVLAGSEQYDNSVAKAISAIEAIKTPKDFEECISKLGEKEERSAHEDILLKILNEVSGKYEKQKINEIDTTDLEKNTLYSFRYTVGAKTKYDSNGTIIANSPDINYTFDNKSIDVEVKRTLNKPELDPFSSKYANHPPAQVSLFAILKLLGNTETNRYSVGVYFKGCNDKIKGNENDIVYIDNTESNCTKIKIDEKLNEKLNEIGNKYKNPVNNIIKIESYSDLSNKEVQRISSMKTFEDNFLKPTIENIGKVVIVDGKFNRALFNEKGNPRIKKSSIVTEEFNNNKNQELFKAAENSLNSIITFCERYGLSSSLQKAKELLPLLKGKLNNNELKNLELDRKKIQQKNFNLNNSKQIEQRKINRYEALNSQFGKYNERNREEKEISSSSVETKYFNY